MEPIPHAADAALHAPDAVALPSGVVPVGVDPSPASHEVERSQTTRAPGLSPGRDTSAGKVGKTRHAFAADAQCRVPHAVALPPGNRPARVKSPRSVRVGKTGRGARSPGLLVDPYYSS